MNWPQRRFPVWFCIMRVFLLLYEVYMKCVAAVILCKDQIYFFCLISLQDGK